ncbi:hypothetical protein R3W88_024981 [Solanum pinnatisectum]|uniref:CCHC-type domain-containing protein n=1 Tax=Solanum pinnatisectum TaxID=50273 RepID=A0AAV9M1R4_9SOLN|nr:hypothetical protein R3W88_024981 [Solanum pinnatisectum]
MSKLSKFESLVLDILGKGYLHWELDAKIHLDVMDLVDTIQDSNQASSQNCAKVIIFLRHHLEEELKKEYLIFKDYLILWNNLKDRYDHLKLVILQQACYDWTHLRLQDFKSISDRLTGSMSFLKVNTIKFYQSKSGKDRDRRDRGRNFNHGYHLAPNNNIHHQQCKKKDEKHEVVQKKNSDNKCYRCGGTGHWLCTCHTPKHLVKLYQASLKDIKIMQKKTLSLKIILNQCRCSEFLSIS